MKTIMFLFLTVAALFFLSSTVSSQQAPGKNPGKAPAKNSEQGQVEAGVAAGGGLALGQPRPMTVEIAKQLVAAAKKASCSPPQGSCSGAFCVADDAGVIVYLETIDGVLAGGPKLCIAKAETPALWRRPTQIFQDAVNNKSNSSYADGTFPNMTTSPGGVPLTHNGRIVGGFGCAAVGNGTKPIDAAAVAEAAKIFGNK